MSVPSPPTPLPRGEGSVERRCATFTLIDAEIVRLLQNDTRLSNKRIAAQVGLAPSSIHDRLRRLWSEGVLTGTHAEVAPEAMGVGLEALLLIELAKHERDTVDRLLGEVVHIPEVRAAHLITGRYDLVVHVVARDTRAT